MRQWWKLSAAALGIAASFGVARAAVVQDNFLVRDTADLVTLCSAPQSSPLYTAAVNFCHGFAIGVFRVLQEENAARGSHALFCIPNPAPTRNEALASFTAWAQANPGQMTQQPADGIAMFLAHQYPCSAKR
jgi:Rap1a immunity proteins